MGRMGEEKREVLVGSAGIDVLREYRGSIEEAYGLLLRDCAVSRGYCVRLSDELSDFHRLGSVFPGTSQI